VEKGGKLCPSCAAQFLPHIVLPGSSSIFARVSTDTNILAPSRPKFDGSGINALGFARRPEETRVVVAMSGGVDSSLTAALLAGQGFEVIGITLQLYDHGASLQKSRACCAGQDIHDARQVAEALDIPHYVLDYESRFSEAVMTDFADSYLRGETPIPCVRCNERVKFKDLLETARDLGADCLATGHYVRSRFEDGRWRLFRGVDRSRDQSYFLFATTPEQLAFLRFPLGELDKAEVRRMATDLDLSVAEKPDSQDICFVPQGNYASVIERLRPGAADPGEIVHLDGRVLGRHDGIIHYTVGQRRGLGIGGETEPLYVVALEPERRRVIVGPRAALATAALTVRDLNWLDTPIGAAGRRVLAQIRNTHTPVPARLKPAGRGMLDLVFDTPEYGVSAGQAAVFYDGEQVLGGGWITKTCSARTI